MLAAFLVATALPVAARAPAPLRGAPELVHRLFARPVVVTPASGHMQVDGPLASRRSFAKLASTCSLVAMAAVPGTVSAALIKAPEKNEEELKASLVLIARVIEATEQEERLINSGKYKDLQRKSVKSAATMMLDNYSLNKNLVNAAVFVPQEAVAEASQLSQEATEALNQIVGYFPAELSVGELERTQKDFVIRALQSARGNLNAFLDLLPQEFVKAARAQVAEENRLNADDYKKIFGEPMLNAPSP